MKLRIGAVSYLNTKPLIYGMRSRFPESELILDLPSRLADRLNHGDLDVALIPSVEFLRRNDLSVVSDACIACRGPVRSVRLLFRRPPSQVGNLALDEGSRTSAVLAQVLLAQRYGIRPELVSLPIEADFGRFQADALVVIGDRAMQIDASRFVEVWDLGEQWNEQTDLSFVFALWVTARPMAPQLGQILQACRDDGLTKLDKIVAAEAPKYGLEPNDCRTYLAKQLYFHLRDRELGGLDLFRRQAAALELLPQSCSELSLEPT